MTTTIAPTTFGGGALELAARGLRVFPVAGKRPLLAAWPTKATSDEDTVRARWTTHPDAGIGIVCGDQLADGLWHVVLDIDRHNPAEDGEEALRDLETDLGTLPDTVTTLTPTGGRHLHYVAPVELTNAAGSNLPTGIDVRGAGGYVVAPPSKHPDGGRYDWEADHAPGEVRIAELPPAWVERLAHVPERVERPAAPKPAPGNIFGAGQDRPGDQWAAATSWEQILTADGWTHAGQGHDGEDQWTRPGKTVREGISATTGYGTHDVLKVFTSNAAPLKAEQTYTKLGYYAAVHHHGDHQAAANALRDLGYGAPMPSTSSSPATEEIRQALADRILTVAQLRQLVPPSPLVDGLLDLDSFAVLYGLPGSHKTFAALDIAARVATGTRYFGGRPVTHGRVLYIATEGAHGIGQRLDAWKQANGIYVDPDGLEFLPDAINLLSPADVSAVADYVADTRPLLVIADTLARCMVGGDENSAKDMGEAIAGLDHIRHAAGSCVLVVHHSGKSREAGARGSSALLGAADTMLELRADGDAITVTPEKQKHHPIGSPIRLRAKPTGPSVALVVDDGVQTDTLTGKEFEALDVLRAIEVAEGVSFTVWTDAAAEAGISKSTLARARPKLLELGLIDDDTKGAERYPRYVLTPAGRSQTDGDQPTPATSGNDAEVPRSQQGANEVPDTPSRPGVMVPPPLWGGTHETETTSSDLGPFGLDAADTPS